MHSMPCFFGDPLRQKRELAIELERARAQKVTKEKIMRVGDKVRDRANLSGVVERIVPGSVCRVLVLWNGENRSWVDARKLRVVS